MLGRDHHPGATGSLASVSAGPDPDIVLMPTSGPQGWYAKHRLTHLWGLRGSSMHPPVESEPGCGGPVGAATSRAVSDSSFVNSRYAVLRRMLGARASRRPLGCGSSAVRTCWPARIATVC